LQRLVFFFAIVHVEIELESEAGRRRRASSKHAIEFNGEEGLPRINSKWNEEFAQWHSKAVRAGACECLNGAGLDVGQG
jgi:hypothetical protein